MNKAITIQGPAHKNLLDKLAADPLLFGKMCLPNMFTVPSPVFHRKLVKAMTNPDNNKLNIIAPRGHAKSSIVACLYVLYYIMFDDRPKVIVLCSKTVGHAIRLLQTIKNALNYSIPLQTFFGYWGEHSAIKWRDDEVVLKDNTLIVCRGTGQMVIGLKHGDQRPTLFILDDPEDMMNTKTAEAMEGNFRWLLQAVLPSRDASRGRVIVIGTPQHERCMVENLKGMEGWTTLFFQAIQEDGTALWPALWPLDKLEAEKRSLESVNRVSSFYREYQCVVVGDEDQLFKESYFRYWEGELVRKNGENHVHIVSLNNSVLAEPVDVPVNVFMGVDPASSTNQTADFTAILALAIDATGRRFVLPYFRQRVTPMKVADHIMRYAELYQPVRTRIESVGYQEMIREYIRTQVYIPGLEIKENPRQRKKGAGGRLEALEPFFQKNLFYMQPNMQALFDELLMYPRGKHDDLLDALYYANKRTYTPGPTGNEVNKDDLHYFPGMRGDSNEDWMLS
jgi:phage terminase large subunit-like protein